MPRTLALAPRQKLPPPTTRPICTPARCAWAISSAMRATIDVYKRQNEGHWQGSGLSHLLEHLVFKGTEHYSGQEDVYKRQIPLCTTASHHARDSTTHSRLVSSP